MVRGKEEGTIVAAYSQLQVGSVSWMSQRCKLQPLQRDGDMLQIDGEKAAARCRRSSHWSGSHEGKGRGFSSRRGCYSVL